MKNKKKTLKKKATQKSTKIKKESRITLKKQADADIAEIRKGLVQDPYAHLDTDEEPTDEIVSNLPSNGFHEEGYYEDGIEEQDPDN